MKILLTAFTSENKEEEEEEKNQRHSTSMSNSDWRRAFHVARCIDCTDSFVPLTKLSRRRNKRGIKAKKKKMEEKDNHEEVPLFSTSLSPQTPGAVVGVLRYL